MYTYTALHNVAPQKVVIFIATSARTLELIMFISRPHAYLDLQCSSFTIEIRVQYCPWIVSSSGIWRRVFCWVATDVSEDPEDGGDMFLRNVDFNSTDYMASYLRRWYSSWLPLWKPQMLQDCPCLLLPIIFSVSVSRSVFSKDWLPSET
jgi:hypothetical protein